MTKARVNADNASADIQGVTAGTGLSGGGTSGTVTLTNDMATAIDAKGDLVVGTGADTYSRLATGNNGETLVADSSQSTGLRWGSNYGFTAGKNKLINGDFRINQRSFSSTQSSVVFTFDRWLTEGNGGVGTLTWSAQTFTPGTAPVAGYEGVNFLRMASTSQSTSSNYMLIDQKIEDVRTLAGQTATLSFWAKASSGTPKVGTTFQQNFGTGGSSFVLSNPGDVTISTSWARYSLTVNIPSVSGKTIGANSFLRLLLWTSAGTDFVSYTGIGVQNTTIDFWGVQVEAGNVATAFQTATGTLAGELAACQRYYVRWGGSSIYESFSNANCPSTTTASAYVIFPVEMRTAPSSVGSNAVAFYDGVNVTALTSPTLNANVKGTKTCQMNFTATGLTQYRYGAIIANNSTSAYLEINAEL